MRTELKKRQGKRGIFTATFERFGTAKGWQGREIITLLFRHVCDSTGAEVTDHLWFKQIKAFNGLGLKPGDVIEMEARVKPYEKGYKGSRWSDGWGESESSGETDFKLAFPTRVKVVSGQPGAPLPLLAGVACPGCGGAVPAGQRLCAACEQIMD